MFADPQTVTVSGNATPLPRVSAVGRTGTYESADGNLTLTISHNNGKRARSTVRLDRKKIGADPINPTVNRQVGSSVQIVVDQPLWGFTDAELIEDLKGLIGLVNGATFLPKFMGGES